MRLTAEDIINQNFSKSKIGGYKVEEVSAFLEIIAKDYSEFIHENEKLQIELERVKTNEAELSKKLKIYTDKVQNSEVDSELIVNEAKEKAGFIIEKAYGELRQLQKEIRLLETKKHAVSSHLRKYLNSQLELLRLIEGKKEEAQSEDAAVTADKEETVELNISNDSPKEDEPTDEQTEEVKAVAKPTEIGDFIEDVELGEIPHELEEFEIVEDEEDYDFKPGDSKKPASEPGPKQDSKQDSEEDSPKQTSAENLDPKVKKVLDDLEKIANVPTGMFKKSDFKEMLDNEDTSEHLDRINEIYSELEEDSEESANDQPEKDEDE